MYMNQVKPDAEEVTELKLKFDKNCERAAKCIHDADVLLLVTGAGFSADSGLAVYGDVAKVDAYNELGLKYHDICTPDWLYDDPALFYGFWGQCFNDYRKTQPHEGYEIIARWRDHKNKRKDGVVANRIRSFLKHSQLALEEAKLNRAIIDGKKEEFFSKQKSLADTDPYKVEGSAGAFFSFTSNVDAHGFDVFEASEIRECHGNVELWQCPRIKCGGENNIWRAPLDHRFFVDQETMRANHRFFVDRETMRANNNQHTDKANTNIESSSLCEIDDQKNSFRDDEHVASIGRTFGTCRRNPLQYMKSFNDTDNNDGHKNNDKNNCISTKFNNYDRSSANEHKQECNQWSDKGWPKCALCSRNARPAILMFGDWNWKDNEAQEQRWTSWKNALHELVESSSSSIENDEPREQLKVVVLEIGCGVNVPTCRYESEAMLGDLNEGGGTKVDTKLVRINADYPLAYDKCISENTISIMSRGLHALKEIDEKIVNFMSEEIQK